MTVAAGYFIINRQKMEGMRQHLLCLHGYEWVYMSRVGNIFGTLHQLLVLMQINITQYVLVRAPDNMGVFKQDMIADLGHQLRKNLLEKAQEYRREKRIEELKSGSTAVAQRRSAKQTPGQGAARASKQKHVQSQLSVEI